MQLFIHIGPHKTGTTAVQTAFARARRALSNVGVLYPKTNWMFPAQHRLAFAMKGRCLPGTGDTPRRDDEIAALLRAITRHKGDRVLVSSEEFFTAPPEAIAWLKEQLGMCDVRVLTFLRRPDSFLVSSYNQKVRQVGNGFDAPIRRFVRSPRQLASEIDYLAAVSAWADVFGDQSIRLETYEAGSPLACTLRHLRLSSGFLPDGPRANVSAPGALAETMRLAKMAGLSPEKQRRVSCLANSAFQDRPPFYLSDDDRLSVIRAFEAENDILFRRFGKANPYTAASFRKTLCAQEYNLAHSDLMQLVERLI